MSGCFEIKKKYKIIFSISVLNTYQMNVKTVVMPIEYQFHVVENSRVQLGMLQSRHRPIYTNGIRFPDMSECFPK